MKEPINHVFPNEKIEVEGRFLLRPNEGITWAIIKKGNIEFDSGEKLEISNTKYPLEWKEEGKAFFRIHPRLLGVQKGKFSGALVFENELKNTFTNAGRFRGSQHKISFMLNAPILSEITPTQVSRGQIMTIRGQGFVDATEAGTGSSLIFEGVFKPTDPNQKKIKFTGASAFSRVPFQVVNSKEILQDLGVNIDAHARSVSGLGATPGQFVGSLQVVLVHQGREQESKRMAITINILPIKQVVYLKYLPGFIKTLEDFGLGRVKTEIESRVLDVLNRDYQDVNIEFRSKLPKDFKAYMTVEIGGTDPSGLLNFGYDNSFNEGGKDVDNLYLEDYLGGINLKSKDAGYLPYGGVFIESFRSFSPTLFPENLGTSPAFDRTLKPFMRELGGRPVRYDEWPKGPRKSAIQNAIDMIANLAGHTASHEIGHALGMAFFPKDIPDSEKKFHNTPGGENWIMDAGPDRPFEERAEIGGKGPMKFNHENRRYLDTILPKAK